MLSNSPRCKVMLPGTGAGSGQDRPGAGPASLPEDVTEVGAQILHMPASPLHGVTVGRRRLVLLLLRGGCTAAAAIGVVLLLLLWALALPVRWRGWGAVPTPLTRWGVGAQGSKRRVGSCGAATLLIPLLLLCLLPSVGIAAGVLLMVRARRVLSLWRSAQGTGVRWGLKACTAKHMHRGELAVRPMPYLLIVT